MKMFVMLYQVWKGNDMADAIVCVHILEAKELEKARAEGKEYYDCTVVPVHKDQGNKTDYCGVFQEIPHN